jgi:hypothetical protein
MAAGALTLLEATKSGRDQVKTGMIETIIQESPIIEMLPWTTIAGNALKREYEDTLPDVQFRNVNESYNSSYGTDTEHYWGVAIMGGEYKVDNFLVDVTGSEADLEAKQITKLAKSNAMRFDFEAINGDGSGKGFKGMKNLVAEGFGQTLLNATGGGLISLDKLDEAHDLFLNQGGADAALLNRTVRRQITSRARTTVTGVSLIDVGTDVFGRQVVSWNGVPLRILGQVRNGSGATVQALPFNEDPGDSTSDCSSLWFVKFGEDDVCGLLGKGGSFDVKRFGELQAAPQRMGRLEWYPGLAIFNQYSVVRLTGITAV